MGEEQEQSRSGVHRQDKAEGKASRRGGRACPLHSERQGKRRQLRQRCAADKRGGTWSQHPKVTGGTSWSWWPWLTRVAISSLQIPRRFSPSLAAFH